MNTLFKEMEDLPHWLGICKVAGLRKADSNVRFSDQNEAKAAEC